jgi:protein-disulfide isomerase
MNATGSTTRADSPTPPRRERRAAARAARREGFLRPTPGRTTFGRRLGVLLAALVGIVLLAVAFLTRAGSAGPSLVTPVVDSPAALADGRALGIAGAPVTVDLWTDLATPAGVLYATTEEPALVTSYVVPGKARLVVHDYAAGGQTSVDLAVALRAADRLGSFWPYRDWLVANAGSAGQAAFTSDHLIAIARAAGLDAAAFTSALADPVLVQAVADETAAGRSAGIGRVPAILVNGTAVADTSEHGLAAAIDTALARTPGTGAGTAGTGAGIDPVVPLPSLPGQGLPGLAVPTPAIPVPGIPNPVPSIPALPQLP